ncbi:LacI family DNA-binding transcriptional regulator [Halobacillus salinarum]|uniref:LacI family DNA-binding transcriptional regulator n=1 Tax=Halobacillus salinarum TaxID=2932257 RepID=A0ABY4EP82_9BACI|nr:LacI family DNA-binding transcriptional regulator [Halobacillus salinarum]UOQ45422.1 LacI family DNA-binding transcriptional regulator [Halobacillus salinarum]
MARIKDIATQSGVSTATVSHVLNNTGRVGVETREKVLKVAAELNYKTNKIAKSLKTQRSYVIGVIVEDLTVFNTPEICDGINEFAEEKGYSISLVNLRLFKRIGTDFTKTDVLKEMIPKVIDQLMENQVEGIIYIGNHPRDVTEDIPPVSVPIVYTYCYTTREDDCSVNYDDKSAAYEATKYLIDLGHEKIGLISGLINSIPSHDRFYGYQTALAENEVLFDPGYIRTGDWKIDSGYEMTKELFTHPDPPTAIVALNDLMAAGAIKAIQEMGMSVPEDVSVIGFDNREFTAFYSPSITTMAIPLHEMGEKAMDVLFQFIHKTGSSEQPNGNVQLSCTLVKRESVKAR